MAGSRGNYKSKHYDELVSWFQTIPGQHVTVQEIYAHFVESGANIGMTTLYRLLDRLTEEGAVAKYTIDSTSPACYEFIPYNMNSGIGDGNANGNGTQAGLNRRSASNNPNGGNIIAGSIEPSCYHCKCEVCGKLIHLHCEEIKELQAHLFREHHFQLNPMRTVMYGICEDCLKAQTVKKIVP
jgi:Fur family ferric uptake transcriptional regulator